MHREYDDAGLADGMNSWAVLQFHGPQELVNLAVCNTINQHQWAKTVALQRDLITPGSLYFDRHLHNLFQLI